MNELTERLSDTSGRRTIWIDLDNSPHVPFFVPIIEALRQQGFSLLLTARDCFQVCELAELHKLDYRRVGRHYGKNLVMKLYGLGVRSSQLAPVVLREKPVLAVSHGSRSQLLLAQILRIPSLRICDYEFVQNPPFVRSTWVMVPDVIPVKALDRDGTRTLTYPGIKEDVYVAGFREDGTLRRQLGLGGDDVMVTVRPPAAEAHYRSPKSEQLYRAAMEFLISQPRVRIVLVPRSEKQVKDARAFWCQAFAGGRVIIPEHVVNGLNLIWNSDLVVSGGGTMNREAAALGVPVYSTFAGKIGAVDRYLAATGRLVLLERADEIPEKLLVARRNRTAAAKSQPSTALIAIVDTIVKLVEASNGGPAVNPAFAVRPGPESS
jgi:predicted glycosyltransferase